MAIRTDLAVEAYDLWHAENSTLGALNGVQAHARVRRGVRVRTVRITTPDGAQQLQKPMGTYMTLELESLQRRETSGFSRTVQVLADALRQLLPEGERVLVVGLGNRAVTPDAVGPLALRSLIVTRHMQQLVEAGCGALGTVSSLEPGVLGTTGIESAQTVRAVAAQTRPQRVVVIDALAAAEPARICRTVQLTDTGIVPGAGVGNRRTAFDADTLGVPVVAIGVPTVVDARTLCADAPGGMLVIPQDIDARVREIAQVIGYALDLALHRGLRLEDIPCFLA